MSKKAKLYSITTHADRLAYLIGFNHQSLSWYAEPEELERVAPGIALALYELLKAIYTDADKFD